MNMCIQGIGVVGPGFSNWKICRRVLAGEVSYDGDMGQEPSPSILPSNERRRSSAVVRWALEVAQQATNMAQTDPSHLPTIFASSGGETEILHKICHSLTQSPPMVSPTLFHQSVHNAAAGYWSIASTSRKASTSLSCYDSSFAGGLLEAASRLTIEPDDQVLLVAYDIPAPLPLYEARPLAGPFAVSLVLGKKASSHTMFELDVHLHAIKIHDTTTLDIQEMENLRDGNPAARSLVLLKALSRDQEAMIFLDYLDNLQLQIGVRPCRHYPA